MVSKRKMNLTNTKIFLKQCRKDMSRMEKEMDKFKPIIKLIKENK